MAGHGNVCMTRHRAQVICDMSPRGTGSGGDTPLAASTLLLASLLLTADTSPPVRQ
jgi:hypothetical protein